MFILLATIHLVLANDLERLAIHDKDAGRAVSAVLATATKAGYVNAFGSAVDRMRTRIARFTEHFLRLYRLVNVGLERVFYVNHIDARGANTRHDQIAAFKECVSRQRRQG